MQKYHPSSRLFARKRVGSAAILCMANELGLLEDCIVGGEYPVGEGFGDAALKLAPLFEMTPATINGAATRSFVNIPIRFGFPGLPEPKSIQEKDMWHPAILKFYTKYAEQGYADAQVRLGYMYYTGGGMVAQDYAAAVSWYRKAADQGNADAQTNVGNMYANGQGVTQDFAAAGRWYRKAADQGNARAQNNVKNLCSAHPSTTGCPAPMDANGQAVVQDDAAVLSLYRSAAERGDAQAQNKLGNMYANGQGVAKDYAAALVWYRKAADQGLADAQNNLGSMYNQGKGVTQDYAAAVFWFRKAADQGQPSIMLKALCTDRRIETLVAGDEARADRRIEAACR